MWRRTGQLQRAWLLLRRRTRLAGPAAALFSGGLDAGATLETAAAADATQAAWEQKPAMVQVLAAAPGRQPPAESPAPVNELAVIAGALCARERVGRPGFPRRTVSTEIRAKME